MITLLKNFLTLLWLSSFLYANDYRITDYRNISDLANQTILDGVQGPDGRLYFLTPNEILVYDGSEFNILKKISSTDFLYKNIETDDESNLWFFSNVDKNEIIKFDGISYKSIPIAQHVNVISALTVDQDRIIFATNRNELYSYENNNWRKQNLPRFFSGSTITGLRIVGERLWVATDKGTFFYNDASLFQSSKVITKLPTYYLYFDKPDSTIFLLYNNELGIFRNDSLNTITTGIPVTYKDQRGTYINRISDTELIIGTDFSHYILDTEYWEGTNFNEVYDIKPAFSSKIFRDSFNNVWICTNIGLRRITKTLFNTLKESDGLLDNYVSAISQFDNGDILAGHLKGMTLIKGNSFIKIPLSGEDGQKRSHVIDLIIDHKQRAWFLIQFRGIGRIDDINNPQKIKWFNDGNFQTMALLKNGDIFVASRYGFHKISDDEVSKVYDIADKLKPYLYFRRVIEASDSMAIVIGHRQVIIFDLLANNIKDYMADKVNMYSVYEYGSELMIGGKGGLFEIQNDVFEEIPVSPVNKKTPEVYFINSAKESGVWLATNKGLFQLVEDKIKHFTTSDGLGDNELNRSAFLFDKEKQKIWAGTISGLSSINLNILENHKERPRLLVDTNHYINENKELFLSYYAVSLYPHPEINYLVKIEGENSDYYNEFSTASKNISIKNLDDDTYNITLKAVDRFANESEEINVKYKVENRVSNAAYFGIVIFVVGFVIIFIQFNRRRKPEITNVKIEEQNRASTSQNYNISTFGSLTIINEGGENITYKLAPKLKELFVLLLIYTFDKRETINGITSENLSAFLWNDSPEEIIKNKRNALVKRLREFLKKEGLGEIIFDQKKWTLKLNNKLKLDYTEWTKLIEKMNNSAELNMDKSSLFVNIVHKGNFLNGSNYDWLEEIKVWHDRECSNVLAKILRNENFELDIRLRAGNALVSIDPLNESEVIYLIKLLSNSSRLSEAAERYKKFNIEYYNLFGKDYKAQLNDIIT